MRTLQPWLRPPAKQSWNLATATVSTKDHQPSSLDIMQSGQRTHCPSIQYMYILLHVHSLYSCHAVKEARSLPPVRLPLPVRKNPLLYIFQHVLWGSTSRTSFPTIQPGSPTLLIIKVNFSDTSEPLQVFGGFRTAWLPSDSLNMLAFSVKWIEFLPLWEHFRDDRINDLEKQ